MDRPRLLAAGLRVLRDEGPAALRVRRVAAAAGCSTMAIYTWFGGKDGLVGAMWLDGFAGLRGTLSAVSTGGSPRARVLRVMEAYRGWALEHPTQYMLMFGRAVPEFEPGPDLLGEAASGTFTVLVEAVSAAQSAGALRPGSPGQLGRCIWGLGHGLVMIELTGVIPPQGEADPLRLYRRGLSALLDGLAP